MDEQALLQQELTYAFLTFWSKCGCGKRAYA